MDTITRCMKLSFLRFFGRSPAEEPSIPAAEKILAEMLDELRDLQRSSRHINGLYWDLRDFISANPRIENWTATGVAKYLSELGVGARRRDNVRDSMVTFARFARRRNYITARPAPENVVPMNLELSFEESHRGAA